MSDLVKFDGLKELGSPGDREDLIRARLAIHASVPLQQLFERAVEECWSSEGLSEALSEGFIEFGLQIDPEVCRFLAQECFARDSEKTLVVSSETGLAVAEVPADAIYVPDPLPREGKEGLAVPLPRLRPELAAAIVLHQNQVAAEPLLLAKLQERSRSTELQKAHGDQRLHIATRSGRRKLTERLEQELPKLLRDHQGSVGRLLAMCRVGEPVPKYCTIRLPLVLFGYASTLVADSLAMNLRHDPFRMAREQIRNAWAKGIAKVIVEHGHQVRRPEQVTTQDTLPRGLLLGSPDLAVAARHLSALPLVDGLAAVLSREVFLKVDETSYKVTAHEAEARWVVGASVRVELSVSPDAMHPLMFSGLEESGLVAELLS